MKNDRLSAYNENLFYHIESDGAYAKGKAEFAILLERFRQDFKYLPKPIIELANPQDTEPYKESYSWESDLKSVELLIFKVRQTDNYISSCSIIVHDKTVR